MGDPLTLNRQGQPQARTRRPAAVVQRRRADVERAEIAAAAVKPAGGLIDTVLAAAKEHQDNVTVCEAGARVMSKSVVAIEVTRDRSSKAGTRGSRPS